METFETVSKLMKQYPIFDPQVNVYETNKFVKHD